MPFDPEDKAKDNETAKKAVKVLKKKQEEKIDRLASDAKRLSKGEGTSSVGRRLPLEALKKGLVSASIALAAAAGDPTARKKVGKALRTQRISTEKK